MKLSRTELNASLDLLRPAIAAKELIEEMVHIWFNGETVTAYNDIIGIEVPLKTDFQGGLRGSLVLGLLGKSAAKEAELSPIPDKDSEMLLKAGAAKLTLALLPPERVVWEFPEVVEKEMTWVDKAFIDAIAKVLVTIGQDTSVPDQLGITFVQDEKKLNIYSTDSKTLSWCQLPALKGQEFDRVCVPTDFCVQLLRLCRTGCHLKIMDDSIVAENASGTRLFARLVDVPRPVPFAEVLERVLVKGYAKKSIPIPQGKMKLALERVGVLLDSNSSTGMTLSLGEEFCRITAKTPHGEFKESIRLESPHEDVVGFLEQPLLKRALPFSDRMWFNEESLVLIGEGPYICLVSKYEQPH